MYISFTHTHTHYTHSYADGETERHTYTTTDKCTHTVSLTQSYAHKHTTHTHTHTHGWRQHGSRGVTQWLQVSTLQHCRDFPPVSSTSIVCASERKQGMCLMRNIMEYVSSEPLVMPYREYGEEYACFSSLASKQHPSMESTSWTLDEWVDMIY